MSDGWSSFGAAVYFWTRLAYQPAYMMGVARVRTLVRNAGMIGLVILIWRLPARGRGAFVN